MQPRKPLELIQENGADIPVKAAVQLATIPSAPEPELQGGVTQAAEPLRVSRARVRKTPTKSDENAVGASDAAPDSLHNSAEATQPLRSDYALFGGRAVQPPPVVEPAPQPSSAPPSRQRATLAARVSQLQRLLRAARVESRSLREQRDGALEHLSRAEAESSDAQWDLSRGLALANHTLEERDRALAERDRALAERDAALGVGRLQAGAEDLGRPVDRQESVRPFLDWKMELGEDGEANESEEADGSEEADRSEEAERSEEADRNKEAEEDEETEEDEHADERGGKQNRDSISFDEKEALESGEAGSWAHAWILDRLAAAVMRAAQLERDRNSLEAQVGSLLRKARGAAWVRQGSGEEDDEDDSASDASDDGTFVATGAKGALSISEECRTAERDEFSRDSESPTSASYESLSPAGSVSGAASDFETSYRDSSGASSSAERSDSEASTSAAQSSPSTEVSRRSSAAAPYSPVDCRAMRPWLPVIGPEERWADLSEDSETSSEDVCEEETSSESDGSGAMAARGELAALRIDNMRADVAPLDGLEALLAALEQHGPAERRGAEAGRAAERRTRRRKSCKTRRDFDGWATVEKQ